MTTIHAIIQDGRINVPAPTNLPDGTAVVLTVKTAHAEDEAMTPQEIERVLSAMHQLEPLDLPDEVTADLDSWERKLNQRGIDHVDESMNEAFR